MLICHIALDFVVTFRLFLRMCHCCACTFGQLSVPRTVLYHIVCITSTDLSTFRVWLE